jgi:hypothetical protein
MDNLPRQKIAAKKFLHHKTMFSHIPVPVCIGMIRFQNKPVFALM